MLAGRYCFLTVPMPSQSKSKISACPHPTSQFAERQHVPGRVPLPRRPAHALPGFRFRDPAVQERTAMTAIIAVHPNQAVGENAALGTRGARDRRSGAPDGRAALGGPGRPRDPRGRPGRERAAPDPEDDTHAGRATRSRVLNLQVLIGRHATPRVPMPCHVVGVVLFSERAEDAFRPRSRPSDRRCDDMCRSIPVAVRMRTAPRRPREGGWLRFR